MTTTEKQNEYRCLTPQEIGKTITMFRKMIGLKQINVAYDAGLDERTVQRIENGNKVSEETLRKVAKALRMNDENYFIHPHHVLSEEEAREQAQKWMDAVIRIDAHRLATLKDCEVVLETAGKIVDDLRVADAAASQAASFKDSLEECKYTYSDPLSYEEKLSACRSLLREAKKLETCGYVLRYGTYKTKDGYLLVSILIVPQADDAQCEVKHMLVPSHFSQQPASLQG